MEQWEEEKVMEPTLPPKNLIQDSEQNEENGYQVLDCKKTKINDTKEPNFHKNSLKEEILQIITENFMEMILEMVNQTYKMHSRNFKTPKIKNEKTQKKINKLIGAFK
jgi:type IV secretory pathway VirB6-like protein